MDFSERAYHCSAAAREDDAANRAAIPQAAKIHTAMARMHREAAIGIRTGAQSIELAGRE